MPNLFKKYFLLIAVCLPLIFITCGKPVLNTDETLPDQIVFTQNTDYQRQNFIAHDFPSPLRVLTEESIIGVATPNLGLYNNQVILTTQNGYISIISFENISRERKTRISKGMSSSSTLYGERLFIPSTKGDAGLTVYNIKKGKTEWEYRGNFSKSSPVVINGLVYHTSHQGVISCLKIENGEQIWQDNLNDIIYSNLLYAYDYLIAVSQNGIIKIYNPESGLINLNKKINDYIYAQSCILNHALYLVSYHGQLYKLNLNTGDLDQIADFKTNVYAPLSSDGERLFIQLSNGKLFCMDTKTYQTLWSLTLQGPISCPVLITNKRAVAATSQKYLYIINKYNGEIIQSVRTKGRICAPPVFSQNRVVVCSEYDNIVEYQITGDNSDATVQQ